MGWEGTWGWSWSGTWGGSDDAPVATPIPPTASIRLFGLDIAGIVNQSIAAAGGVLAATLIKVFPGTRTPGSLALGTNATTASYAARGFFTTLEQQFIDGDLVKRTDRAVVLLGASIPGRVVPVAGDRVRMEGRAWQVIAVLDRDPAAATYTLAVRG